MKTIDLKHAGLQELEDAELRRVNGGVLWVLWAPLLVAGVLQILDNWEQFKEGLMGKPETPEH